jgi:hypothetical protein
MEVRSINRAAAIAKVWVEFGLLFDFGWCVIGGKMKVFGVEWPNETREGGINRAAQNDVKSKSNYMRIERK